MSSGSRGGSRGFSVAHISLRPPSFLFIGLQLTLYNARSPDSTTRPLASTETATKLLSALGAWVGLDKVADELVKLRLGSDHSAPVKFVFIFGALLRFRRVRHAFVRGNSLPIISFMCLAICHRLYFRCLNRLQRVPAMRTNHPECPRFVRLHRPDIVL